MTNIYNKTVLSKNGTLERNWFEERVLRDMTGEGRSIAGSHIPKVKNETLDTISVSSDVKRDNTNFRINGTQLQSDFKRTHDTYGDFKTEEKKYQRMGIKDKIFQDFFNKHVEENSKIAEMNNEIKKNIRIQETTKNNEHLEQIPDYTSLGRRLMYNQDRIPINVEENVDKLFMANHGMSKFPSVINNNTANGYIDKSIPYFKDKEITFWSMNLEKGNIYRSHPKGINAFAKSSGFTQPLNQTKSSKQFEGNVQNNTNSRFIHLNEEDNKFVEEYMNATNMKKQNIDQTPVIKEKILSVCKRKGWVGLRKLKIFLRNLNKRRSNLLDNVNFKYFLSNFDIFLSDNEIKFIYDIFDRKRNNHIDFMEFLESLVILTKEREEMLNQIIASFSTNNTFSFQKLQKKFVAELHPEVINFIKPGVDVVNEYYTTWDNLKEDDIVLVDSFRKYFCDVSLCVESDSDFIQILKSCGF